MGQWDALGAAAGGGGQFMQAFMAAKQASEAKRMMQAEREAQAQRQAMLDQRYETEQATKGSQFDQEMEFKRQQLAQSEEMKRFMAGEAAKKRTSGRPLGAVTAEELGDRLSIPTELQKNAADVNANPSLLGPENFFATKVPFMFAERKDVSSKVGAIRKLAARAIEGARLTDSDMAYYQKNLPSETDTPREFQNKTKNLVGLLSRATSKRVQSLGQAGFDVSGYDSDMEQMKELSKLSGETGLTTDPRTEMAKQALNDPEATPEEKAAARRILGQ
jgi:predicted RNA-binding protein with EMAP domain